MVFPLDDDNPTTTKPYVTVGIMIACTLVYLWQRLWLAGLSAAGGVRVRRDPGGAHRPRRRMPDIALAAAGSHRLHLDVPARRLLHLAGNMLYLWVFGNNVEDAMGHGRFFIFYLLCGVAAVIAQVLPNPDSIVPMIGASGAISGVLGAYMLLYPRARVLLGLPIGFLIVSLGRFPAVWVLAAWFLMQLIMGGLSSHAPAWRERGRNRVRRARRGIRRGTSARHAFQTARRAAVAAILRRCYIPRASRALGSKSPASRGDFWPSRLTRKS